MTLKEWMSQKGLTQQEVADAVGTHQTNVSAWLRGRAPGPHFIIEVEKLTEGAVTFYDWFPRKGQATPTETQG